MSKFYCVKFTANQYTTKFNDHFTNLYYRVYVLLEHENQRSQKGVWIRKIHYSNAIKKLQI